jgi:hypothetical protein
VLFCTCLQAACGSDDAAISTAVGAVAGVWQYIRVFVFDLLLSCIYCYILLFTLVYNARLAVWQL